MIRPAPFSFVARGLRRCGRRRRYALASAKAILLLELAGGGIDFFDEG
jgi:hypothetical protein